MIWDLQEMRDAVFRQNEQNGFYASAHWGTGRLVPEIRRKTLDAR